MQCERATDMSGKGHGPYMYCQNRAAWLVTDPGEPIDYALCDAHLVHMREDPLIPDPETVTPLASN